MEKILAYSVYFTKEQNQKYEEAYSIKSKIVDSVQRSPSSYGSLFETILILYVFETYSGEFENEGISVKAYISRYKRIDKSIRITFYVDFLELEKKNVDEQVKYYYDTTMEALSMTRAKLTEKEKQKVDFDFDLLVDDIRKGYAENRCVGSKRKKYYGG